MEAVTDPKGVRYRFAVDALNAAAVGLALLAARLLRIVAEQYLSPTGQARAFLGMTFVGLVVVGDAVFRTTSIMLFGIGFGLIVIGVEALIKSLL